MEPIYTNIRIKRITLKKLHEIADHSIRSAPEQLDYIVNSFYKDWKETRKSTRQYNQLQLEEEPK